jgi:superfamily I DNA/RNA helicase
MDPFEPVRDVAAKLHMELVEVGTDPLSPILLVQSAVDRLELELHWLKPGDPALKGARALFDNQSGSICCEDSCDEGEKASLVAHELGHAVIHAGSSACSAVDIDLSRSTESAPVGLQRVEDYGIQERRELQANVFAREFLFPRIHARKLYVDDGMGASEIATKTGLPKNLVRQQLFDALFIPKARADDASTSEPVRALSRDDSQERAAAHRGSPFLLQAGPGTGKTRTLVKTALSLIEEGIDPSAILILTFSNRAAGELSERIAAAAPNDAAKLWIGTFHAFGLDLVRRFHDKLGLPAEPKLFDRSDAIAVLQEIVPTLPIVHYRNLWDPTLILRDIIGAISRAKDELTGPTLYRSLSDAMLSAAHDDDERKAAEKCLEVATIYDLYAQTLKDNGAVDFGDLIMRPAMLLESDEALRSAIQLRHRHVLVDEYQDVNRASTRLLRAVAGDGARLWVVGDARQSIYRFRGASSTNMAAFATEYPNSKPDQLSVNYRSTQEIVDVVLAIAPRMGASEGLLPLAMTAERGRGGSRLEIRRYNSLDDEAAGIAAAVRELEGAGTPLRDQAILCRTNPRLNELALALEARGIPVLHLGSLFERSEVRDLLALVSIVVDAYGDGLARIGAMPRYGLSLQDVRITTQWIRASGRKALEVLPELAGIPGLSKEGAAGLTRLAGDFEGVRPEATAWELLATLLLDRFDHTRDLACCETVSEWMRAVAVWQFLNFVREQPPTGAGWPIQRLLERVRQLVLLAEERDLRQVPAGALHMDAVRLLTVHGSKGLEFDAVHIPGLTVSSFPSSNRGQRCPPPQGMLKDSILAVTEEARQAHANEEECLFFVAFSRARTHCVLHLSQRQPNGNSRSASPFLKWLSPLQVLEVSNPPTMPLPPGAPQPAPIVVVRPGEWHLTDSQLRSYEKCPLRYFYTHVLGLGGARVATAFTQTHDCIYRLLAWMSEKRRSGEVPLEDVEAAFEEIWNQLGPTDHGFAAEYRRLASALINALVRAGADRKFLNAEPLGIDFSTGRVVVEPNEIAELPDGAIVLRRVQTGRKRSDEYDRLDYALYHLAGKAKYGAQYKVEAIHLTDDAVELVTISSQKLANRSEKSVQMLSSITDGWYPTEIDAVACPRCPHFFICSAVPKGNLTLA